MKLTGFHFYNILNFSENETLNKCSLDTKHNTVPATFS